MKSVIIAGVNGYSQIHHRQIERLEQRGICRLSAVIVPYINGRQDASDAQLADLDRRGIATFPSFDAFFDSGNAADIACIPVGIPLHHSLSVQCLRAGCDVICEKPLSGDAESASAMVAVARETGRRLIIAYQYMYTPSVNLIRDLHRGGSLGALRRASTIALWPRDSGYFDRNRWAGTFSIHGTAVRDCPLNNACAHFMQNMLFVAAPENEVVATESAVQFANFRSAPIETADTQDVTVTTTEGIALRLFATHACRENSNPFTVYEFESAHIYWTADGMVVKAPPASQPQFADRESLFQALDASRSAGGGDFELLLEATEVHPVDTAFDAILAGLSDGAALVSEAASCLTHARIVETVLPTVDVVLPAPGTESQSVASGSGERTAYIIPDIEALSRESFRSWRPIDQFLSNAARSV